MRAAKGVARAHDAVGVTRRELRERDVRIETRPRRPDGARHAPGADRFARDRQLNEAEVELMNEGKALAEQCGAYVEKLRAIKDMDQRWISIGATDLQRGFMAVIRGIAKPETF